MITLRPYQTIGVDSLRQCLVEGYTSPLFVLPTGGGKTVCFSYMTARAAERGKRSVILVHREELIDQVSRTLSDFNVEHGLISANSHYDRKPVVHVASVFTLVKRLERVAVPDFVIADEAHHAIDGSTWGKVIAYWRKKNPKIVVMGVTATPERLSGEGLGGTFDTMVLGPSTRELIDLSALCEYRLFAPRTVDTSSLHTRAGEFIKGEAAAMMDKPAIIGDVVGHYRRFCDGLPSIAFCPSVEHAKKTAEKFQSSGYRSMCIDGGMDKDLRRAIVRDYGRGAINVLTSCALISEGFDVPGTHAAILLNPTMSLSKYLQEIGRASRPSSGKKNWIIIDHVGNSDRHGKPDDLREWSLEGREERLRREAGGEATPPKQCGKCFIHVPAYTKKCKCGNVFAVQSREVEEREGELEERRIEQVKREAIRAQARAETLEALTELGKMRGYKDPAAWAGHIIQARQKKGRGRVGAAA